MSERELTAKQRQYFRQYRPRNTEHDWDMLRMKVPPIEILSLPVAPLYMEVLGTPWPGKRRTEPIDSYFECSYEELVQEKGMKPKEIDLMMDLVSRVVRTEEGERGMVQSERINDLTNDFFLRTLEKFDIRPDLPIDFVDLDEESLNLCAGAGADDLEKILRHGVFLSEKKFLGGQLKDFVNAVSTESQQLMARFLPILPGERGVKPWKAMEIFLRKIPEAFRAALPAYYSSGAVRVPEEEQEEFLKTCKHLEMISLEFRALYPEESRAVRDGTEEGREVFSPIREEAVRSLAEIVVTGRQVSSREKGAQSPRKPVSCVRGLLGRVGIH